MQRAHFLERMSLVNLNLKTRREREVRSRKRNEKECDDTYRINLDDLSSRTLLSSSSSSFSPSPLFFLPSRLTITRRLADRSKNTFLIEASLSLPETVSCETEREKLVAGTCCTDIRHVFRVRCARALVHERQRGEERGERYRRAIKPLFADLRRVASHDIDIAMNQSSQTIPGLRSISKIRDLFFLPPPPLLEHQFLSKPQETL